MWDETQFHYEYQNKALQTKTRQNDKAYFMET